MRKTLLPSSGKSALTDFYEPRISPTRSVLGHDLESLLNVLEELGIIWTEDRAKLHSPGNKKIRADTYSLMRLSRIVEARESRPQNIKDNLAYLEQVAALGLLSVSDQEALRNDSTFLQGSRKLPAIRRFQKDVAFMKIARNAVLTEGFKSLKTSLRAFNPAFKNIKLNHQVSPRDFLPGNSSNLPDLVVTITGGDEEQILTSRSNLRAFDKNSVPLFSISTDLIISLNDYLAANGSDKKLYSVGVFPDLIANLPATGTKESVFLLLTLQEAKTVIVRTMEEMFRGPEGRRGRR